MVNIVIAGIAKDPFYSKCELLADQLARNLPNFNVFKRPFTCEDWDDFLQCMNRKEGWHHASSPLVYREIVERGGRGQLIGNENDFQEYVKQYYGIGSAEMSKHLLEIGSLNMEWKQAKDKEEVVIKELSNPHKIAIINALDPVVNHILPAIASGSVLQKGIELSIHLVQHKPVERSANLLSGLKMEIEDMAYPVTRSITVHENVVEAVKDAVLVIWIDNMQPDERKESKFAVAKRRKGWYEELKKSDGGDNIFKAGTKIFFAGDGPLIANATCITTVFKQTIVPTDVAFCVTTVENQAKGLIARHVKVNKSDVRNVTVWGDPFGYHVVDKTLATLTNHEGALQGDQKYIRTADEIIFEKAFLEKFDEHVKSRTTEICDKLTNLATRSTTALSTGTAIVECLTTWYRSEADVDNPSTYSLGVYNDSEAYGIRENIFMSFPVRFSPPGRYTIATDLPLTEAEVQKYQQLSSVIIMDRQQLVDYSSPEVSSDMLGSQEAPIGSEQKTDSKPETLNEPSASAEREAATNDGDNDNAKSESDHGEKQSTSSPQTTNEQNGENAGETNVDAPSIVESVADEQPKDSTAEEVTPNEKQGEKTSSSPTQLSNEQEETTTQSSDEPK